MNARYQRERELLQARVGDTTEVTSLGGPIQYLDCGPSSDDFVALAIRGYERGDLTVEELEQEVGAALTRG